MTTPTPDQYGTITYDNATTLTGTVTFHPSVNMVRMVADAMDVSLRPVIGTMIGGVLNDPDGTEGVKLYGTDNTGNNPIEFYWTAVERLTGQPERVIRNFRVPAGSTQALSNLVPSNELGVRTVFLEQDRIIAEQSATDAQASLAAVQALVDGFQPGGGSGGPAIASVALSVDHKLLVTMDDATVVAGPVIGNVFVGVEVPATTEGYSVYDGFINLSNNSMYAVIPDYPTPGVSSWLLLLSLTPDTSRFVTQVNDTTDGVTGIRSVTIGTDANTVATIVMPSEPVLFSRTGTRLAITLHDNTVVSGLPYVGNVFAGQSVPPPTNPPNPYLPDDLYFTWPDSKWYRALWNPEVGNQVIWEETTSIFANVTTANISDFTAAVQAIVNPAVTSLIDGAPGALDTFNELAAALNDNPNLATDVAGQLTTMTGLINGKSDIGHQHVVADITGLQTQLDGIETTPGADGDSAYQVWLDAGNTGTVADFLAALKGVKGDTGDAGAGILVLGPSDPIPGGTPASTVVVRTP